MLEEHLAEVTRREVRVTRGGQPTHEHGTAQTVLREGREFYPYVENQARGFGQEESQAAQAHVDRELRRYRQADGSSNSSVFCRRPLKTP
eukprot:5323684-Amphidinium_carterae.1